ncbi:MAG: 1-acyl-sn-glycerol-3-phosphate acyltransferase [Rhodospirillales bacterium]|nr:1-acyl-sn-glycerol-3-phosphate acyltransferase [Rhodospirillales bacterium]
MIHLRSLLFNVYFFALTAFGLFTYWVLLPLPRPRFQEAVRLWQRLVFGGLRHLCGLAWEVRGRERIPGGAAVFACKHQSAWDTMAFYALVADPAYVLKKELLGIPFWGWYARKTRQIVVDRRAGLRALKEVAAQAKGRLAEGRQVVIFPQGTRVAPPGGASRRDEMPGARMEGARGVSRPYQPGIYAIASAADAPVFPVALDSGLFWGRRSFLKYPGTVTIEILEPMPRGLARKPFMAELEKRIEEASTRLAAEARERFPWLGGGGA